MINNTSSRPRVPRRRWLQLLPNTVYECHVRVITFSLQSSNINNNSLSITNI
ncbi:rCG61560 [Rattus norvegicus]|uniref:RCG61560 n=1 Tax=Rattus norvegicus TaxID=10116 RepID=A6HC23_RAT|nr:rCG61560 [Rattus norvegicus]